jgi:hypothetical protein
MTEEQRAAYHTLLDERRREFFEQMRQRFDEGGEFEPPDFAALEDQFYSDVAGMLDEGQQMLLSEYRGQFGEPQPTPTVEVKPVYDLRKVLQAMKRVRGLTSEQREALREIEREAKVSYRAVRRDKDQAAKIAAEVKTKIVKVLDAKQAEAFNQTVERLHARGGQDARRAQMSRERERPAP